MAACPTQLQGKLLNKIFLVQRQFLLIVRANRMQKLPTADTD